MYCSINRFSKTWPSKLFIRFENWKPDPVWLKTHHSSTRWQEFVAFRRRLYNIICQPGVTFDYGRNVRHTCAQHGDSIGVSGNTVNMEVEDGDEFEVMVLVVFFCRDPDWAGSHNARLQPSIAASRETLQWQLKVPRSI